MKSGIFLFLLICLPVASSATEMFKYCVEGEATNLDPNQAGDVMTENTIGQQVFNKLVDMDLKTGDLVPSLAEKWKISKDGKTYSFFLRKNVTFHERSDFKSTRNFNADDVIATFNRMIEVRSIVFGPFEAAGFRKLISKVEKKGDYQVDFVLNSPDSNLLSALTHPGLSIHSAEFLKAWEKDSKLLPIGTGPFVLQKFQKDSQARYLANEKYWNGVPKIKNLVTLFVPDGSVRIQKLKTGECDFISEVSPVDRTAIEADKKFTLHERAGFNYGYVGFNNELEKFKDVRVRRAIAHALDVDKYLKLIFLGRATRAEMPVIKGMMGYTSTDPIKYDVKKFEALRKEVGDKFPRKISLLVIPMSRPYNPSGSKMAELIQADLKTVGIDVELVQYDWQAFFAAAKQGKYEMILLGGNSTSKDSGVFLNAFFSCDSIGGFNVSRFCNPEFEKALTRAKETTSFEKKDKILQGAMKIFMRELPTIPVAHGNVARASRKGLTDYVLGPAGREDFSKIDLVETKIQ